MDFLGQLINFGRKATNKGMSIGGGGPQQAKRHPALDMQPMQHAQYKTPMPQEGQGINLQDLQRAALNGAFTPGSQVPGMQVQQNGGPRLQVQQGYGMQPNMQPQFEDAYTPDLALNQTYTQGNPQPTQFGYQVQRGGNPQEDFLRRLLGY